MSIQNTTVKGLSDWTLDLAACSSACLSVCVPERLLAQYFF